MSHDESGGQFRVAPADERAVLEDHAANFAGMEHIVGAYMPNSLRLMARDPELLRACTILGGAIMRREGRLGVPLKWMVGHVVSAAAGCRYCSAHTVEHGVDLGLSEGQASTLWEFETSEHFSPRQRAALRFAFRAAQLPVATTDEDFVAMSEHFDEDEIIELVSVVSYWAFWNRWNDTLATPLEDKPADAAARFAPRAGERLLASDLEPRS